MKLRHWISAALYAVLTVILVATVVVAWIGSREGTLKPLDLWAGAIPVFVAIVTVVLGPLQSGRQRRLSPEETAREQVTALAEKVNVEWQEERLYRGLYEGRRTDLRWEVVTPGSDPKSRLATALPDRGTLDQLTSGFGHHTRNGALTRLVVTGDMGAGKTAACVLLTLELLGDQSPLVPVLFQLASWDPHTSLHEWMTDELLGNYPFLSDHEYGRQVAGRLARHHILPVLDGLDEVRESAAALQRIEDELAGRPFVLSCRTAEFAAANAGHVLHHALIVQLQPLRADEARDYLLGYEPGAGQGRLAPLVAKLDDQPTGPVAAALRTPFMLSLAVAPGEPVPEDLLAAAGPDATDRIQRHLLGTFADKAYASTPGQKKEVTTPEEARRYLEFLARHVDPVTGRLAWWRLHLAVPGAVSLIVAVVIAGAACSGLAAGYFTVFERPWLGFWIGLTAGVTGAFIVELIPQEDPPRRARPRLRSVRAPSNYALLRTLGFGLMGAAACAVIVWFLYESPHYVVIGGALSGLTFAMARYLSEPSDPMKAVTPDSLLRNDRAAALYAWLAGGIPGALTGAYLGASLRDGHRTPELDDVAITTLPPAVLALLGAIAGFGLSAAGLGLMAHGSSSWGRFITTRVWLSARGSTPLRLMTFLREARRRGVLRQVNGYYEFRHRLLQHHLAEPSPETSAGPAAPPESDSLTETTTGPDSAQ